MHFSSSLHLGGLLEARTARGLHRPRSERGLNRHEGPSLQMRTDAREGAFERLVGRVVRGRFDRRLDTHRDDVGVCGVRGIEARTETVLRDLLLEKALKTGFTTPER